MGMEQLNTTAYNPQTDALAERLNRILLDMLSKTVKQNGKDWDSCLLLVIFAYQACLQFSTGESYSTYGMEETQGCQLKLSRTHHLVSASRLTDDYITELTRRMSETQSLAGDAI